MEEILVNILNNIEKKVVYVDENNVIKYLNKFAEEYYSKKGKNDLLNKSIIDFHKDKSNEKIKEAVEKLKNDCSLKKVDMGHSIIYPIRINDKFCGYYKIF